MRLLKSFFTIFLIFVFQFTTYGSLLQYGFGASRTYAQSGGSKVDLVAILVSDAVYAGIKGDLQWYTSTYIPSMVPGTKSIVIPVNSSGFEASDIQQILENLYYDGQEGVASQLVGVILFGDVPMPLVELDGRRFVSMYPYVDFEDPMFLFDPVENIFTFNQNPSSLPEVWHSTIPVDNVTTHSLFFKKLKQYFADPEKYAARKIWYDDIEFMKKAFTEEEYERYINTLIFAESDSYRQYAPVLSGLINKEYQDDLQETLQEASGVFEGLKGEISEATANGELEGVDEEAGIIVGGVGSIFSLLDPSNLDNDSIVQPGDAPIPAKILEKQIQQDFTQVHQIFGNKYYAEMQDNITAGGRYAAKDVDTVLEKLEMRDRVSKTFIKDMNTVMEDALESKITYEDYQLKYPLPFRVSVWEGLNPKECFDLHEVVDYDRSFLQDVFDRFLPGQRTILFGGRELQQGPFKGLRFDPLGAFVLNNMELDEGQAKYERYRYEQFYFGKNAVDITNFEDLTIMRGTPLNIRKAGDLAGREYPTSNWLADYQQVEDLPEWDMTKVSVGSSMGVMSQQTQNSKAFNFDRFLNQRTVDEPSDYKYNDKELYDELKCQNRMTMEEFSYMFWGGASPTTMEINPNDARDLSLKPIPDLGDVHLDYAWNPSVQRVVGGPRYDPAGAVLSSIDPSQIHGEGAVDQWGRMTNLRGEVREGGLIRAIGVRGFQQVWFGNKGLFLETDWEKDTDQTFEYLGREELLSYDEWNDRAILYCLDRNNFNKWPEQRQQLDLVEGRSSTQESDFFWVYENQYPGSYGEYDYVGITVQPTLGYDEDIDTDGIPNIIDSDKDGDGKIDVPPAIASLTNVDTDIDDDDTLNEIDNDKDGDGIRDVDDDSPYGGDDITDWDIDGDGDRLNMATDLDLDGDGLNNGSDRDTDGDGIPNRDDRDINGNGIHNGSDSDPDGDFVDGKSDRDIDADGLDNPDDRDIDGDGLVNRLDNDQDSDGENNQEDDDADADETDDLTDRDNNCGGGCNGGDPNVDGDGLANGVDGDVDGDEVPNGIDRDVDGDGLLNKVDGDIDGDGKNNDKDEDMDGDGIPNADDSDTDGDGVLNENDGQPNGIEYIASQGLATQLFVENCEGDPIDADEDGIINGEDFDVDNDGLHNAADGDVDGDGIPNGKDSDIDCDGLPNNQDNDADGDGIENGQDDDVDGDGIPNDRDEDIDGDGIENGFDRDCDGDGRANSIDLDCDGDGIPNENDSDVDGDGVPNDSDGDIDGDGLPNHPDLDNDGIPDADDTDKDGDGIPDSSDDDIDGDGELNNTDATPEGAEPGLDSDIDGDGIPNGTDPDINGNGVDNWNDPDMDGDLKENPLLDTSEDIKGVPQPLGSSGSSKSFASEPDDDSDGDGILDEDDVYPYGWSEETMLSQREDRGDVTCIEQGFDYRYQIVDTLVTHKAVDEEEFDKETTIMTLERPIDDGRYVTFHGIGGDVVKFMYPDLYNVPIYDCNLEDPSAIEAKIILYLQEKVQYYNELLGEQLAKAPSKYSQSPAAFDFLSTVDSAATPNRSYELMDLNYFVDLMGETNIKRLAQQLYVMNKGRETRPTAQTIGEFIDESKANFDLNEKIKYTYKEFLNYDDPADEFKFDKLAFPTHMAPTLAYEVGYINSVGYDYVMPEDGVVLPDDPNGSLDSYERTAPPEDSTPAPNNRDIDFMKVDNACGVPPAGVVPLLKWPQAFTCWLNYTIENPYEFSLEIEFDVGELGEYWSRVQDFGDQPEAGTTIGYVPQVYAQESLDPSWSADKKNTWMSERIADQDITTFKELRYDFSAALDENYLNADVTTNGITLAARKDIGVVSVTVTGTGDLCPRVAGRNVCESPYIAVNNFNQNVIELPVTYVDGVGGGRLSVAVCDTQNTELCAYHDTYVHRGPGTMKSVALNLPAETIVAGAPFPVEVAGVDEQGNKVYFAEAPYKLVLDGASFSSESVVTTATVTDFKEAFFVVYPLSNEPTTITLTLKAGDESLEDLLPQGSITITTVAGNLAIGGFSVQGGAIDYTLVQKEVGYYDEDAAGIRQLRADILPTFTLSVRDQEGNPVSSPIRLQTTSNLFRVGIPVVNPLEKDGQSLAQVTFDDIDEFIVDEEQPTVQLSLLPLGKVGEGSIIVSVPGLAPVTIPVVIRPSGTDNLEIILDTERAQEGDIVQGTVKITDSRGNKYSDWAEVELEGTGGLDIENNSFVFSGGEATFTGKVEKGGTCGARGKCNKAQKPIGADPEEDEDEEEDETDEDIVPNDPDGWDLWTEKPGATTSLLENNSFDEQGSQQSQPSTSSPLGELGELLCSDEIDNDGDELVDCDDEDDCLWQLVCGGDGQKPSYSGGGSKGLLSIINQNKQGSTSGESGTASGGETGSEGTTSSGGSNAGGESATTDGSGSGGADTSAGSATAGESSGGTASGGEGTAGSATSGNAGDQGVQGVGDTGLEENGNGTGNGIDDGSDLAQAELEQGYNCSEEFEQTPTPDEEWFEGGAAYGETETATSKIIWPFNEPDDDINVMYLNLYGGPRGSQADTTKILENSKTLSITTYQDMGGESATRDIVAAQIHPNGKVIDRKNIVKELVADGGDVAFLLGYDGGIGKVLIGSSTTFDFMEDGGEYEDKPNKLVFKGSSPSVTFEGGRLTYNDEIMVDFVRGTMDQDIFIRLPEGGGDTWAVTYKNKVLGTMWVYRGTEGLERDVTIERSDYRLGSRPFGNSSTSQSSVAILLDAQDVSSSTSLFESIESSADFRKNIGFRHEFSPITNFAQGMNVGESTKHFGSLLLMNIGDPFLLRIGDNRMVKNTIYDAGPGQKIFSDGSGIDDVDQMDWDKDGKKDFVITYKDGGLRLLKNYGGKNPFKDMGMLMVVADGIKQTYVGDLDGDGREDILVHTQAEKLRAYMNNAGKMDVDGTVVCLDIPNGDQDVSQAKQVFAVNMDGGAMDIVTYDTNGDLKVFYGGGGSGGPSYLSLDEFGCDENWKERQNMQLIKNFGIQLGGAISDNSIRHWAELTVDPVPETDQEFDNEEEEELSRAEQWIEDRRTKRIKSYAKEKMEEGIGVAEDAADPLKLLELGKDALNVAFEIPDIMRPAKHKGRTDYYGLRANDLYVDTPRFDVEKVFVDQNGGNLVKDDLVTVNVSLIGVGGVSDIVYLEKLDGPWTIFRDEFGKVHGMDEDALGGAKVDRNIGQGYEFMIYDTDLGSLSFSYTVQFKGEGYMHIDVETLEKDFYRGEPTAGMAPEVYAQGGRGSKIRAYSDDGCYNQFREFSPGEQSYDLDPFREEKEEQFDEHFTNNQDEAKEIVQNNTDLGPIEQLLGVPKALPNEALDTWKGYQIWSLLGGGHGNTLEIDTEGYTDYFVKEAEQKIEDTFKTPMKALNHLSFGALGSEEMEFNKCGGVTVGKKTCGAGWPIPFNNDLLSPGSFHIFGCKPSQPNIPDIFPDFDGVPIFAFPTDNATMPVWPPSPTGAGGIPPFKGSTSQIRTYLTWTTSNGLGLSLCFGPYGTTNFLPTPFGDVSGNCLVVAGNLGAPCFNDDEQGVAPATSWRAVNNKETEATNVLSNEHHDLYNAGVCDPVAHTSSPFVSSVLGGPVALNGTTSNALNTDFSTESTYGGSTVGFERLEGGEGINLEIEGGMGKGIAQCILKKWVENQTAYFANNALNMQINVILPDIDRLRENMEDTWNADKRMAFQYDWTNWSDAKKAIDNPGPKSQESDPKDKNFFMAMDQSTLNQVSETFTNPFEAIGQLFENIPLVNFEERLTVIQIPWIYQEDIDRALFLNEAWLKRNTAIIEEWASLERAQGEANQEIDAAIAQMRTSANSVKRNVETLRAYKKLPVQLYELLHSSDQYIVEVIGFVQQFLGYIAAWLQDNANRFSGWVDVIITLKAVVQSRQLLIDFTVNRQSKCAKCRQDNYDYYSCKLKLLCFDLPVLPIPPFHLPNIEMDFTNIDIGIDFILPKFHFVPTPINIPQVPDFPVPKEFLDVDIVVPIIPILPAPPPMPELPTLDLDLDLTLATLPPAPKIPRLSPVIETVITVADIIGTLMCIFKGGIGLVSEENIKPRVEQMTQRKNDILPFDELELKFPSSPVQGTDYKIDAFIDIKADFRQLYDYIDNQAVKWNEIVNKNVDGTISKVFAGAKEKIAEEVGNAGSIPAPVEVDVNIDVSGNTTYNSEDEFLIVAVGKTKEDFYEGGTAEQVKQGLLDGMNYLLSRTDLSELHPQAKDVIALVKRTVDVTPNYDALKDAENDMLTLLQQKQSEIVTQKDLIIQDYDAFLDTLTVLTMVDNDEKSYAFDAALFETDAGTQQILNSQEAPMLTYFNENEKIIDGYRDALARNRPEQLNMTPIRYEQLGNYLDDVKSKINVMQDGYAVKAGNTAQGEQRKLLASHDGTKSRSRDVDPKLEIDYTQFIKGFYMPGQFDDDYYNVIDRQEKGTQWYKNNTYEIVDINNDKSNDIVNYDDNQIYIKYGKQNSGFPPMAGYGGRYEVGPYSSADALAKAVEDTKGWYQVNGERFKIWDDQDVVSSYERFGQSYDAMSFVREQDPDIAGYVIELTERVSTSQEKSRGSQRENDPQRTRYMLALPTSLQEDNLAIEIYRQLQRERIEDYIANGTIVNVLHYDAAQVDVQALFKELDRKRHYTKIAPLRLVKFTGGGIISRILGTNPEYVLRKVGPWSLQRLAGAQYRADEQPPYASAKLIRVLTDEEVAKGQLLQGYINTTYRLDIEREDNAEVIKNWLVYDGEIVKLEDGEFLELEDLDYKYPLQENFMAMAIDQAGNIGQQEISIEILVPELDLREIRYQGGGAEIVTELSQTIDRGQIKFQRNRFGVREALDPDSFPVKPTDPEVIGGLYPFDDDIILEDSEGNELGTIDMDTGEISLQGDQGGDGSTGGDSGEDAGGDSASAGSASAGQGGDQGSASAGTATAGSATSGQSSAGSAGDDTGSTQPDESASVDNSTYTIVDFSDDGTPEVQVWVDDGSTNKRTIVFSVHYSSDSLVDVTILDQGFELRQQGTTQCIAQIGGPCWMQISADGNLFMPEPYRYKIVGTYEFDNGEITYMLKDKLGNPRASIRFISEQFN